MALAIRNACALARNFIVEHFGVVIDDVVGPETLRLYLEKFSPCRVSIHFVILLPSLEVLLERDRQRPAEWHTADRVK